MSLTVGISLQQQQYVADWPDYKIRNTCCVFQTRGFQILYNSGIYRLVYYSAPACKLQAYVS